MPDEYGDRERYPLVYLPDEHCFGIVVAYGAYVSRVKYYIYGTEYEVDMPNEEFIERKVPGIEFITE